MKQMTTSEHENKMKAIRIKNLQSSPEITVTELPVPQCKQPDDVKVKVLCIGLDGTDREILVEHYGTPPEGEKDLTNGHESLGVVVEAGETAGLRPGTLVTALVRRPCNDPSCVNCRNGHSDFCETGKYVERGIKGRHGYLAEYYVDEARYVVPVPTDILKYGMLAEPQSIVEKVWAQAQHVQQRLIWEPKTALVLGSGPLGLLAAFTCRCLGLDTYVWSRSPEDSLQAELVRQAGGYYRQADQPLAASAAAGAGANAGATAGTTGAAAATGTTGTAKETLTDYARSIGKRFDIIFECTGYSPLAFEAIDVLGPNGLLALLGVTPGQRKLQIGSDKLNQEMVLENKCVLGSVNASRKDFETGLYRLQQIEKLWPGQLGKLITERLTLDQVPTLDFKKIVIKSVVDIVPQEKWEQLVKEAAGLEYSFSV